MRVRQSFFSSTTRRSAVSATTSLAALAAMYAEALSFHRLKLICIQVGYDNNIVSHYGDFYNSDGSLSNYDFGFSGHDIGSNYYVPSNNWNQDSSPSSVGSAYQAAQAASWY